MAQPTDSGKKERLQKILAQVGIASRRKAEELIEEGLVTVNGKVAKLGDKASLGEDSIKVKGKLLQNKESPVYVVFYKPRGVISTLSDPEGRPALSGYLGKIQARLFPIGRLDFNSEGLLLLTNDGAMAEAIQKLPNLPKVYHVKVKGHPTPEMIERLKKGARVENRVIHPYSVRLAQELSSKAVVEVVITEPGVADIKKMFELKGLLVDKLARVAIGQISVREMKPGAYRFLKKSQMEALVKQPELGLRNLEPEDPAPVKPKVITPRPAAKGKVVIKPRR